MRKTVGLSVLFLCFALLVACNHAVTSPQQVDEWPGIYPDYVGVTIPATIAPMNFCMADEAVERIDVRVCDSEGEVLHVNEAREALFPEDEWRELLQNHQGDSLVFIVAARREGVWTEYRPSPMYVSTDSIDYGLVYRKIAPGYEVYSRMGIYERDLSSFDERALFENTQVTGMCVNCHAFNRANPAYLSLHIRGEHGGTLMQAAGRPELLDTKTDSTLSALVYPYWHPSGEYVAYSVNVTRQGFHTVPDERIEVFDTASDVVVYHPATHELLRSPLLGKADAFETFPVFSADGRRLYFCSASAQPMPQGYKALRYHLCSIDFDPDAGAFGSRVDTLLHAEAVEGSISFPRPSYDGRYLMFTRSDYGQFSIWHNEADLWLLDLQTGEARPLDEVNSARTESFHNWSGNSRWFVFSSRRDDGLYTRLYLATLDADGCVSKPFLLPQRHPATYYASSLYSYNVPDFVSRPVELAARQLQRAVQGTRRQAVELRR